ncbi:NAD(P)/FAD-dependent oxidoreductase [Xanthomonadaceae bacterium JHOS43]|nr:NAD(P)/FAD-dependent oxidoreductase [Xanthomonadaceae bacterium JHOS43]
MTPDTAPSHHLTLIGAGLAGALLGLMLARRGWNVDIFERRPDPRVAGYEGGRSINLALAERGLDALRRAGLEDEVMAQVVMMRGRMVHFEDGTTQLQRYGRDDSEVIWSVHRGRLVMTMLDAAEAAGARIRFNRRLEQVDRDTRVLKFVDDRTGHAFTESFSTLMGSDGAGSSVRAWMARQKDLGERFEALDHGYKELEIPPSPAGDWRIEPNALHIWPRGGYMCIALPNTERSFTVTLFLPDDGEPGFSTVRTGEDVRALFARDFPDALAQMPNLATNFLDHPTGMLATLYLDHWHLGGDAVLLGDAAHPMVPFHGQGMNCAFEDCVALVRHIEAAPDFESAFAAFEAERRPNARAIQEMALENYVEMRDRVDDADYLVQRELEQLLAERHPDRFIPRYTMVTFRTLPYAVAQERGRIQRDILIEATRGLSTVAAVDWGNVDAAVMKRLEPVE